MMHITYIKKIPGINAILNVIKEIIDEKIISKVYAIRIADYILDSQGHKWWKIQGTFAATEMLYQFDDVAFWIDGTRYEGFLTDDPDLDFTVKQGDASLIFNAEGWFLKDE